MEMSYRNFNHSHQHPIRQFIRLPDYDYTQPGAYFVTICTHERKPLLGDVSDGNMLLNSIGEIVKSCWADIKEHFTNTELSAYVIMPNHLHGIIIINDCVAARHAVPDGFSKSSKIRSKRKNIGMNLPFLA